MRALILLLVILPWWAGVSGAAPIAPKRKERKERKESKPHPAEVLREGKIMVVRSLDGGEPQLTADDGQRWLLSGLLKEELLRLDGHKLKTWGLPGDKKLLMPTLDVNRYDIVDAGGGRRPVTGVVRRQPSGLVLERKEAVPIEVKGSKPMLDTIEKRLGCKVWLVGDLEGQAIKVFKFGWLSCKPPKNIKTGKEKGK